MEKIYEIFKSISSQFTVLITVSLVSLSLLLSPKGVDYKPAIRELEILKTINLTLYEQFIKSAVLQSSLLPKPGRGGYGIDSLLLLHAYKRSIRGDKLKTRTEDRSNFTYEATPYISSFKHRPIDGSLTKWVEWIRSDSNAAYYRPNWGSFDPHRKPFIATDTPYIIKRFILAKMHGSTDVYPIYTYRIYLEKDTSLIADSLIPSGRRAASGNNWPLGLDTMKYDDLPKVDKLFVPDEVNAKHVIIEGNQQTDTTVSIAFTGVNKWLKESSPYWKLITREDGDFVSVLPNAHAVWSEISDKTIDEAISYLDAKGDKSKSISLFDIDISYTVALILIPMAYLCLNTLLIFQLKYLNAELQIQNERPTFPWFGLYLFRSAKAFQFFVFLMVPLIICVSLIVRLAALVGCLLLFASIVLTVLIFFTGIQLIIENRKMIKFAELPAHIEK